MTLVEEVSPGTCNPCDEFRSDLRACRTAGVDRGATDARYSSHRSGRHGVKCPVSGHRRGRPLSEAALLANTAAGVVVGKLGTASVSPDELAGALDEIYS